MSRLGFVLGDLEKNTKKWNFFALKWVLLKNDVNYVILFLIKSYIFMLFFYLGCTKDEQA